MDSINMNGTEEELRSMNKLTTKLVTKYKDDTEGNLEVHQSKNRQRREHDSKYCLCAKRDEVRKHSISNYSKMSEKKIENRYDQVGRVRLLELYK